MRKYFFLYFVCGLVLLGSNVFAKGLKSVDVPSFDKEEFNKLAQDVFALSNYRPNGNAQALGITGFDIKASMAISTLKYPEIYREADGEGNKPKKEETLWGSNANLINLYGVQAIKGLPLGFDVGASLGYVDSMVTYGAVVRNSLLNGSLVVPAVVLRGFFSGLKGVSVVSKVYGVDLSVGKSFLFVTPYASVGYAWGNVSSRHKPVQDENGLRVFAGVDVSFLVFLKLGYEYSHIGEVQTNAFKLSANW